MAQVALQGILGFLFLLALITGTIMLIKGGKSLPGVDKVDPTVDGELRFYAAFWIGYGLFCLWLTTALPKHEALVPIAAGLLFLSGIGRLLSRRLVGEPAPMFFPIMIFELVTPPIMLLLLWAGSSPAT